MERSILCLFAHPDDESFISAGVAARYAGEGVRTILVTATRGERGKVGDPPICSADDLPRVREAEGRRAAAIIGFAEVHFLDYRDKELADAPADEIRRTLVGFIRRHRPTVIVTFDPDGMNRHVDHVAISRFTSDAVAAAADGRWYPDVGEAYGVPRLQWTPPLRPW
jgi:LmbE family N-acetylglucosaminyl deacetylase